jgi:hypothetical protein
VEEEGLENGARVDFKHQKRDLKTPEICPKSTLGVSVWRKRGFRMELVCLQL